MRILIDLQGAQTESRFRGIGRYSLSLTQTIAKNARNHEIWLALNSSFPSATIEIREIFSHLIPAERIHVFTPIQNVAEKYSTNVPRIRVAEKIRENFIHNLKPDIILVTSLFEGYLDDAVTSIDTFTNDGFKTAVILYDLIPLQNESTYLPTTEQKHYYYNKIKSLKNAGLLLAISEYSRDCALKSLHLRHNNIINISSAANPYFRPTTLNAEEIIQLKNKLNIKKNIILYVSGGFDARKNFENLIIAYSQLPNQLKQEYQLVIASKIYAHHRNILMAVCHRNNISTDHVVITDYVSDDELLKLYNIATLFVFPSRCEGFGLPILEAMSCGTPVIGSDNSSIPEVIGLKEALFDANSPNLIAAKMEQALTDENFRHSLHQHALQQAQKFSWDNVANNTLDALENHVKMFEKDVNDNQTDFIKAAKPRLAFFSPLPPLRTGIADYSSELLLELTNHFQIEIISDQEDSSSLFHLINIPQKSIEWFKKNSRTYDRILYHIGNSPFHTHMLELLDQYPGVVVLHDFFLSNLLCYEENFGNKPGIWSKALLHSHGYAALQMRSDENTMLSAKNIYPCNLEVLQKAKGIIVHSNYSKKLANSWYHNDVSAHWHHIPLLRVQRHNKNRAAARNILGITDDTFVVCSFGLIDPTKLNHVIVNAWLASKLHKNEKCKLFFVGENHGGDYGRELTQTIRNKNICITEWCDTSTYQHYLEAADIAIQLRTLSRGETSAALLDCMSYSLATIINANGSMAELPPDTVWKLEDEFSEAELIKALETLWENPIQREQLSLKAKQHIAKQHNPSYCATQYAKAIEKIYEETQYNEFSLVEAIRSTYATLPSNGHLKEIAQSISQSSIQTLKLKQILVDVSNIAKNDLKSGIQRVVRAQLLELIKNPPQGYQVEPVYLSNDHNVWHYKYARKYMHSILNLASNIIVEDSPIDIDSGDIFYGADFACYEIMQASQAGILEQWRVLGVQINILIYDLLPIFHPEFFPPGANGTYKQWLTEILKFAERVIGISYNVTNELRIWLDNHAELRTTPLKISAVPLGADISASAPTLGLPPESKRILSHLKNNTTFLMVGTIEPRKGYLQVLNAFEQLWAENCNYTLVIIGKEGWIPVPEQDRRTIPETVDKIRKHQEWDRRLFWLDDVSDEYLEEIYKSCTCLIAASEGEGFGLPLIEASKYHLPIIARDLPVFRELANENVYYFNGVADINLADAIRHWSDLHTKNMEPKSEKIPWITWEQNVKNLVPILLNQKSDRVWAPPAIRKKAMDEHLNYVHAAREKMISTLLPQGSYILDLGGANNPLYKAGYSYPFKKLTLIDLPPTKSLEYYEEMAIDDECALGHVVIRYSDMTTLQNIEDESIDLVWSGQSIGRFSIEKGKKMFREAFRVLKKGGAFCFDTPNRHLTQLHTLSTGGGFIHPEHYVEYFPEELIDILSDIGFIIKKALGICEMQETVSSNEFHYADFIFGKQISENINDSYIQYFHCIKK